MGRTDNGEWSLAWTPPTYSVDENGKRIGYVNENVPNNWGRWGDLDERGTANYITPEVVAAAGSLIKTGKTIGLAIPLDASGPVHPTRPGIVHFFGYNGADFVSGAKLQQSAPRFQGADDYIFMPLQGSTQIDGLAHIYHDDVMYNGFWMGNTEASGGAGKCAISNMKDGFSSRGVLLDIPRHFGKDRLEPGTAIMTEDLEACAKAQGVEVRSGDILIIRTGHVPWFYTLEDKSEFFGAGAPGLSISTVEWLHEKEVAVLATDNVAVEVEPHEEPHDRLYPMHVRLIRDLGMTLGEIWWLEELAAECEAQQRWEFFCSAAPMNVTGGAGSVANPIAIF